MTKMELEVAYKPPPLRSATLWAKVQLLYLMEAVPASMSAPPYAAVLPTKVELMTCQCELPS